MQNKLQMITVRVENQLGVLTRVTTLIRREGWQLISLAVAQRPNTTESRLNICIECRDSMLPNILDRITDLTCVIAVKAVNLSKCARRELGLIRFTSGDNQAAISIGKKFGANVIDENAMIFELTASADELDEFIAEMKTIGNVEISRSGEVTIEASDTE